MAATYTYNRDSLSYEVLKTPLRIRARRLAIRGLLAMIAATGVIYLYSHFFETPRAKLLRIQNAQLAVRYEVLGKRLQQMDDELNELLQRDNNVYRSIFEAEVIPLTVREAGLSDVAKYESLNNHKETMIAANTLQLMNKVSKKAYVQSKSLDEIAHFAIAKENMIECIPSIQPVPLSSQSIHISCLYGYRVDPVYRTAAFHYGIDLAGPIGTPIHATGNGKIEEARFTIHGYGNNVMIDHGYGYKTRYAHMNKIYVEPGQEIKKGEIIGEVGNTGKSTGPHLHYEVLHKGTPMNPTNFFSDDLTLEEFNKMIAAVSGNTRGLGTDYLGE